MMISFFFSKVFTKNEKLELNQKFEIQKFLKIAKFIPGTEQITN